MTRNLGSTWIASLNTQSFPNAKSWVITAPENTAWPALGSFLVLHFWQGCRKIWRRRARLPRKEIPPGSVGIGGAQTGIYPLRSPGGWNLIGRTPLKLFNPTEDPPTLLCPGDRVRFRAIRGRSSRLLRGKTTFDDNGDRNPVRIPNIRTESGPHGLSPIWRFDQRRARFLCISRSESARWK